MTVCITSLLGVFVKFQYHRIGVAYRKSEKYIAEFEFAAKSNSPLTPIYQLYDLNYLLPFTIKYLYVFHVTLYMRCVVN